MVKLDQADEKTKVVLSSNHRKRNASSCKRGIASKLIIGSVGVMINEFNFKGCQRQQLLIQLEYE